PGAPGAPGGTATSGCVSGDRGGWRCSRPSSPWRTTAAPSSTTRERPSTSGRGAAGARSRRRAGTLPLLAAPHTPDADAVLPLRFGAVEAAVARLDEPLRRLAGRRAQGDDAEAGGDPLQRRRL